MEMRIPDTDNRMYKGTHKKQGWLYEKYRQEPDLEGFDVLTMEFGFFPVDRGTNKYLSS